MSTRLRHREDVDRAHEVQSKAAVEGGLRGTAVGLGLAIIGHHSWPLFRRQPLAFKAFLVSTFTVFGLVFGAENALQAHEAEQRYHENKLRKEARYDLARRGVVPTETEIAKWKREKVEATQSAELS
ncbi:hypothetical protein LshimejAT787_0105020 [Lyophyllum shimeji]|uniref:Uncharacterized protein n=1 Tax=Lyophyllum shimeji TaxID=47721 RepID=A0A9P3PDU3_LYOSH|nr:hypothetical protein LshimejAT787_0105020 [Lyophyllum shimeji]